MTETKTTHTVTESDWTVLVLGHDLCRIDEVHLEEGRSALTSAADQALATEEKKLLLDLSAVEFFGSSFIEVLFRTFRTMRDGDGRFAVCGCNVHCQEVLEITRLDSVWNVFPNRQAAISHRA